MIRDLIGRAAGRIVVMPGAGLTPENMAEVARETGAHEFHGTFRSPFAGDMCYLNESLGDEAEENTHWLCDAAKLGKLFQTDTP
ncbi:MAG: copper homeostasis protein CutC [Phocaeicola sp.]